MGRAEMLARMDSKELTGFLTLLKVHAIEREAAEEQAKMRRDSDDGEVIAFGTPRTEFDDDDDEGTPDDDGTAEQ